MVKLFDVHWQEGLLLHAFQTPSTLWHVYLVDLNITTAVTLNGCLHRLSGCLPCRNRYCSASACQILKFFTATSLKLMQFTDGIFIVARQTGGAKPKSGGAAFQTILGAAAENARVANAVCVRGTVSSEVRSWSMSNRYDEVAKSRTLIVRRAVLYSICSVTGSQRRDCRSGLASLSRLHWQTTLASWFWAHFHFANDDREELRKEWYYSSPIQSHDAACNHLCCICAVSSDSTLRTRCLGIDWGICSA